MIYYRESKDLVFLPAKENKDSLTQLIRDKVKLVLLQRSLSH